MSKEMFNPSSPEFKKVEDLPETEQPNFENVEKGFIRKEAAEELRDAEKIAKLANEFKKAGQTIKDIHGNTKGTIKEIRKVLGDEEITTMSVLRNRAEAREEFKPTDVLHAEANEINLYKYPEKTYLERLRNNPNEIKGIPKHVWDNRKFALEAVRLNRKALAKIMNRRHDLKVDTEIVLEAVRHDGLALQYAPSDFKNDKDIVLEAIKQNPDAIKFASKNIKNAIKKLLKDQK